MTLGDMGSVEQINQFLINAGKGSAFLFLLGVAYFVIILQDNKSTDSKEVDKDDDSGTK